MSDAKPRQTLPGDHVVDVGEHAAMDAEALKPAGVCQEAVESDIGVGLVRAQPDGMGRGIQTTMSAGEPRHLEVAIAVEIGADQMMHLVG